jgi:glutathione S-transferase
MKLRYSATSPFVRKVLVCAIELGLDKKIERQSTNPNDPASDLVKQNPLVKVPSLQLDDGSSLYDSPVICEYLDSLAGNKFHPAGGQARWTALRRQALADGIMDAGVLVRGEVLRPAGEQSPGFIAKQKIKMTQSLDSLEAEADRFGDGLDIGLIAVASALGYVDFRFAADNWRARRPKLARWYDRFAQRPSMQATAPKDP